MDKKDLYALLLITTILLLLALFVLNLDKIFPTPTVQEAIKQAINAT
ncbi:Uncharacterised protein [uncultured archaeon]|nr:Uncharacterised protein [uncultured archaeon]